MTATRMLTPLSATVLVALAVVLQLLAAPHASFAGGFPTLDVFGNPLCIGIDDAPSDPQAPPPSCCVLGCVPSVPLPAAGGAVPAPSPYGWLDVVFADPSGDAGPSPAVRAGRPRAPPAAA